MTIVLLSSVLMAAPDYVVTVAVFLFQILTKHEYHGELSGIETETDATVFNPVISQKGGFGQIYLIFVTVLFFLCNSTDTRQVLNYHISYII